MPTPLVRLLPMSEQHYPAYQACFVEEYAQDLAGNQGLAHPEARRQAEFALQQLLPQGCATAGHTLVCIVPGEDAEEEPIGYLWHAVDGVAKASFIYDFYIQPSRRGRGYGKAAMTALESELAPCGIRQIRLRVAHDNPRALALYQELGYVITGYNMTRHLG